MASYLDNGKIRIKRIFLLFPMTLYNKTAGDFQRRWLEFVNVEQICQLADHCLWYEWKDMYYV